jgi:hypothetical protein
MAKTWVLDTDTKGTGAEMVPLEKVQERKRSTRAGSDDQKLEEKPRRPRSFKVVDVMTRRPLVEGVGIRETLELLDETRSVVDVIVYVWDREEKGWRPLTMREQKLLWARRSAARASG